MHRLVPSLITENLSQNRLQGTFSCAALFLDISGFTSITEALMGHGQHGAEVMASVMRTVFTPLVRSVFEQGGFVTNFAGDALTAVFPTVNEEHDDAVLRALAAAWQIQQHMATNAQQNTQYGDFAFSAKVGLAAGEVTWGIIKTEETGRAAYYFRGSAIEGCAGAEKVAHAGDIIAAPSAYEAACTCVLAQQVDGHWRIERITANLPQPQAINLPDPDVEQMARFFPRSLIEQDISGEFRQVLTLFISVQGSPDHAALSAFMEQVFRLQKSYGGVLNRLDFADKGCHLLLFWGAPTSYENDVTRILDFTLDLCGGSKLPVRAGITYRIAHAGSIGSPLAEEYTCYGRGVNLAARHMMAADWGEIWLDGEVAQRAETEFRLRSLGAKTFKGFAEAQPVYGLDRRRERTITAFGERPIIGRNNELRQLREAVEPIYEGRFAGVVIVSGEAGIGKSRLVHAFLDEMDLQRQAAVFLCQTDEILRQSLNPFRYFLRHYFDQSTAQDEGENKRRFEQTLERLLWSVPDEELNAELERTHSFLGSLLGLHWEGSLYEQLEPELRFENTLDALKTLFKAESTNGPVIIQLEDAHWLDQDSMEFLRRLTRNVADYPFALLVTSRTELPEELFDAHAPQEVLALRVLEDENVTELATAVLGQTPSPALLELLAERTDGNPFFMEQLLLYLRENNLLEQVDVAEGAVLPGDIYVPTDVRAILTARLDRLPLAVKDVVQKAAVLGREFETSILETMVDHDPRLPHILETAAGDAVWFAVDEMSYLFRHALLRDAAYDMQLHSRLRQLHKSAALAFEDQHQHDPDLTPRYPEIAYHFDKAEERAQASRYYGEAGADYQAKYNFISGRETIYQWLGQRNEQKSDLKALETLLDEHPDDLKHADLALRQSSYSLVTGNYEMAAEMARHSLGFAHKAEDIVSEAKAYHRWGRTLWQQGRAKEAEEPIQNALDLVQAGGGNLEIEALCHYDLNAVYIEQANFSQSDAHLKLAKQAYEELGDKEGLARCQNGLGLLSYARADYSSAIAYYEQALELCQQIGWRYIEPRSLSNIGNVYFDLGNYRLAQTYHEQSLAICREIDNLEIEAISLDTLGLIAHYQDRLGEAIKCYENALTVHEIINNPKEKAFALTHLGYVLLDKIQLEKAKLMLEEALQIRRDLGVEALAIDTMAGLAQLYLKEDQLENARHYTNLILSWIDENGAEGIELPVLVYLICYQVMQEAAKKDSRLWIDAQLILEAGHSFLEQNALHIQDSDLRQQFMENVPYNRALQSAWLEHH
jgi:predicted ATPase/class 3 adenylate cyclase